MPTRSGTTYLVDESSEPNPTLMDSQQLSTVLADLQAKLKDKTLALHQTNKKVDKIIADCETSTFGETLTPSRNNRRDNIDNSPNPDDQFMKSIKIDVPNFDGHHNSQLFIYWTLQLDKYFTCYDLIKS